MTVFGGYDPGTFQAWSLNLLSSIFVSAGVARGFQVTPTSPVGMSVQITVDPTYNDAVLYLSNGCWMRVDTAEQFSISPNSSGSTRTDALVATVDPINATNLSLAIQANWAGGFTPGTNQFVVALISVANGASSITSGNITMNSAAATISGTSSSGSNSMVASDGVGLTVQDNSSTSTLSVVLTGLTTGIGRDVAIQTTDISAIGHVFLFDTTANFKVPGNVYWGNGGGFGTGSVLTSDQNGSIELGANASSGAPSVNTTPYIDFHTNTASSDFDVRIVASGGNGTNGQGALQVHASSFKFNGSSILVTNTTGGGAAGFTVWEGTQDPNTLAAEGDVWIDG